MFGFICLQLTINIEQPQILRRWQKDLFLHPFSESRQPAEVGIRVGTGVAPDIVQQT
jgi:hypothetical protein